MLNVKNILFTTDFSECADHVLKHAIDLKKLYDAKLHIFHANVLPTASPYLSIAYDKNESLKFLKTEYSKKLRLIGAGDIADSVEYNVETDLDAGNMIYDYAKKKKIDLIVMGTHGRTGFQHAIMGSVTEKVIRKSKLPVFTAHASDTLVPLSKMKDLVVPLDFSASSAAVLDEAVKFAKKFDLRLNLLHIVPKHIELNTSDSYIDVIQEYPNVLDEAMERLKDFEKKYSHFNNLRLQVSKGKVVDEILEFCNDHEVDMIMMAKRGYSLAEQIFLGKTTERLIQKTNIPLMVLPS